jgi:tRNA 2-thiouridine synthesizing protein B
MGVLHLVGRSPHESRALSQCLARMGEGDGLLLLESGVYAVSASAPVVEGLRPILARAAVYALAPDLAARGLEGIVDGARRVDDEGFVALTLRYSQTLSWF